MTTAELVRPARSRAALNRLHGHGESRFYRDRLSMIAAVGSSRAAQVVRPLVSSTSSAAIRATTLPGQPAGGGLQLRVQVVQVPAEPALQPASASIGSDVPGVRADCRVAAISFGGTRT